MDAKRIMPSPEQKNSKARMRYSTYLKHGKIPTENDNTNRLPKETLQPCGHGV